MAASAIVASVVMDKINLPTGLKVHFTGKSCTSGWGSLDKSPLPGILPGSIGIGIGSSEEAKAIDWLNDVPA